MRILVIGGTRFIGRAVVKRLADLGHVVTLFHRSPQASKPPAGVREILGDRRRIADFAGDLARLKPDVVIDMIAMTEADASLATAALRGIAGRYVLVSSQDVYAAYGRLKGLEQGPFDPVPLTEDAPLRSRLYPYRQGASSNERWQDEYDKILVERVVMGRPDLPGTVLRLPMVYGLGDYQHRLFPYLRRMDTHRPAIPLSAELSRWRWTRGYVDDVAEAIVMAAKNDRAAGRIYNVGERDALSMGEWVSAIAHAAGWRGQLVTVPDAQLPDGLRAGFDTSQDLVVSTDRIRSELGYREGVPREEALRRTVEWEQANPPGEIDPAEFDYALEDAVLGNAGWPATQKEGSLWGQ